MEAIIEYVKADWQFLIALAALLYVLYIRPSRQEKKRIANPDNQIRVGDTVACHNGIAGRIVKLSSETITIESGRNKERFTFGVDELDTNFSAEERNKKTWESLSLWQKLIRKV